MQVVSDETSPLGWGRVGREASMHKVRVSPGGVGQGMYREQENIHLTGLTLQQVCNNFMCKWRKTRRKDRHTKKCPHVRVTS